VSALRYAVEIRTAGDESWARVAYRSTKRDAARALRDHVRERVAGSTGRIIDTRPSGPTIAEVDREAKQVLLRLRPGMTRRLDALARRWGVSRSEAVARMVDESSPRGRWVRNEPK